MVALIRVKEATRSKTNSKKRRQCKCSSSKRLTELTAILLKRRPKIVPEKNPERSLGVSGAFLELDNLGGVWSRPPGQLGNFFHQVQSRIDNAYKWTGHCNKITNPVKFAWEPSKGKPRFLLLGPRQFTWPVGPPANLCNKLPMRSNLLRDLQGEA